MLDPSDARDLDRPAHYGGEANPFEAIKVIEHYGFGFCIGNVLKYMLRAGKKTTEAELSDLRKARWYLDREIQRLEKSDLARK
jgi:hypothetical protein